MDFYQHLLNAQHKNNSLLCVGLDTDPDKLPLHLRSSGDAVLEFNRRLIDATKDIVCAYKINLAFYEGAGARAWDILHQTLASIPEELVTIGDAKRGDIGNSSEMYARTLMEDYRFTASTVSPYMGEDSVRPFIKNSAQGAFILAVTSNPGAKDFQYLKINGRPLYEQVIKRVKIWNSLHNCGLVVGATRPAELKKIRSMTADMPFLIPGIGAQGGDLKAAVKYGCDANGAKAVINASRSIIYASKGEDFAEAARSAALALRDEINRSRDKFFG